MDARRGFARSITAPIRRTAGLRATTFEYFGIRRSRLEVACAPRR